MRSKCLIFVLSASFTVLYVACSSTSADDFATTSQDIASKSQALTKRSSFGDAGLNYEPVQDDLMTAAGEKKEKYILVKKKPKYKKVKMEVYEPKMKYKKIKMKIPVKKMKKKKVKGYLIKKEHGHGHEYY